MKLIVRPGKLSGEVEVPASKSHTIRAVCIASLARGKSRIHAPLESADTEAACDVYAGMGAGVEKKDRLWEITGFNGLPTPPETELDVKNSGTTLRMAMSSLALMKQGSAVITGDAQIKKRPVGPLAEALGNLGALVTCVNKNGCPPVKIAGTLSGGRTEIECQTSQYLSSLLLNAPLADNDTRITVTLLNEAPYVYLTLKWLDRMGIRYQADDDLKEFIISGGQHYDAFDARVPADFSSATFFLAAGAIGQNSVTLNGLDMNDPQGDKAVVQYLKDMGARVSIEPENMKISVSGSGLKATTIDMNNTPDALPMMAVAGALASGTTRLENTAHARLKETDRISVMKTELAKMGAQIREFADGLEIRGGKLTGAQIFSHDDHRVAMSLAVAATAAEGETVINNAEAVRVTYPGFTDSLRALGADIRIVE